MRSVYPFCSRFAGLIIFCALTSLVGCSSMSPAPGQTATLRSFQPQIEMSGRLSAQYEANYRDQSISVHFTWTQSPDQTLISLSSPTGQTVATILINASGATLMQADKPPQYAGDINQLTTDMLGWPLPVGGLRDWLQGFLSADHTLPITPATSTQPFHIDGWEIRYVSWATENNTERPKRLDLSRQTERAGLVALRIVVDEWNTP